MKRYDLQTFADSTGENGKTALSGKKIIYLYRIYKNASTADATHLAFTTENGRTKSKDADSTETKDGSIRTPGATETEITASSILSQSDTFIDELEDALDGSELIEIWEVNLAEKGATTGKYKAWYFQGYITEIEQNSNAEDMVELSLTFGINGVGARGEATVTEDQLTAAKYKFTDTTKTGA